MLINDQESLWRLAPAKSWKALKLIWDFTYVQGEA